MRLAGYLSFKAQAFKNKDCIVQLGICFGNLKPRQGRAKWGSLATGTAMVCAGTSYVCGSQQRAGNGTTQWVIFKLQIRSHIKPQKKKLSAHKLQIDFFHPFRLFLNGIPELHKGF